MEAVKANGNKANSDAAEECLQLISDCLPDQHRTPSSQDQRETQACYERAANSAACRQALHELEQGKAKAPAPKPDAAAGKAAQPKVYKFLRVPSVDADGRPIVAEGCVSAGFIWRLHSEQPNAVTSVWCERVEMEASPDVFKKRPTVDVALEYEGVNQHRRSVVRRPVSFGTLRDPRLVCFKSTEGLGEGESPVLKCDLVSSPPAGSPRKLTRAEFEELDYILVRIMIRYYESPACFEGTNWGKDTCKNWGRDGGVSNAKLFSWTEETPLPGAERRDFFRYQLEANTYERLKLRGNLSDWAMEGEWVAATEKYLRQKKIPFRSVSVYRAAWNDLYVGIMITY